jgi:hypothetical protein
MKNVDELSGDELLDELGVEPEAPQTGGLSARQERILAGFEDIVRFRESQGRAPQAIEGRDIFERMYAVRLEQLRKLPADDLAVIQPIDTHLLLQGTAAEDASPLLEGEELLAELRDGLGHDIGALRHVSAPEPADQIADRIACKEFARFKPLFDAAQADLQAGRRETKRFMRDASVAKEDFFILRGDLVYVADLGETIQAPNGESDARLRVIYANGTESNLLRRSLQRALYKDENGRRITQPDFGPLFGDTAEPDDIPSGIIYVLRSLSNHPFVADHRELIHKIGVTGGKVETRIAGAADDATYLLAKVEVIATYALAHINRTRLEAVFHRVFAPAQLDLTITDRFGKPVHPREWFLVPLHVIDEAVKRIRDGSIADVVYAPTSASLVPAKKI